MAARVVKQVQSIYGIPSLISKIHAENFDITKCKEAVILIPGNPGIIRFYDSFLESLYTLIERKMPVFGIQHAGHGTLDNITIHGSPFSLTEQIDHKLAFLENYFPQDCKFILIGHSIGAYMILKLLEYFGTQQQQRITKGILLFPTIERMAISPSGRLATPVSNYFSWPLIAGAWMLSWLPLSLKKWLISIWFSRRSIHEGCKDAVIQLVNANTIRNMLFMAAEEMEKVDKTPVELISDHIDKLIFYYGASDSWTPRSYYDEMVHHFPTAQIYLCEKNIRHAFVLESHHEMAKITAEWIE